MEEIGDRIRKRRAELGYSQETLAAMVGVTQGLIGQIENGRNKGSKHIVVLARALQCSPEWLSSGRGDMQAQRQPFDLDEHPEYSAIKRVKFKLSAGVSGYEVEYLNGNRAPIFFRRDWLEARSLDPEKLMAVEVSGQSMEPSLFEGDVVVLNVADVRPTDGDVFAVNYDGELVIKRLMRDAGEWYLASDNADKRRFPNKLCDERTILVGRIVHKQSERI